MLFSSKVYPPHLQDITIQVFYVFYFQCYALSLVRDRARGFDFVVLVATGITVG